MKLCLETSACLAAAMPPIHTVLCEGMRVLGNSLAFVCDRLPSSLNIEACAPWAVATKWLKRHLHHPSPPPKQGPWGVRDRDQF